MKVGTGTVPTYLTYPTCTASPRPLITVLLFFSPLCQDTGTVPYLNSKSQQQTTENKQNRYGNFFHCLIGTVGTSTQVPTVGTVPYLRQVNNFKMAITGIRSSTYEQQVPGTVPTAPYTYSIRCGDFLAYSANLPQLRNCPHDSYQGAWTQGCGSGPFLPDPEICHWIRTLPTLCTYQVGRQVPYALNL